MTRKPVMEHNEPPLDYARNPLCRAGAPVACGAAIVSAIEPEVLLHLRHNLRIREFVSGCDTNNALRKRLGSAETFLEFQLCLTRTEYQQGIRLTQLTDDLVVVLIKALAVPCLVLLLASAILLAGISGMRSHVRFQGLGADATL